MRTEHRDAEIENGMLAPSIIWAQPHKARRGAKSTAEKAAILSTEQRLKQLNIVKCRLKDSEAEYKELKDKGLEALRQHDASLVSLISPGMRLTPQEVHEVQLNILRQRINADKYELRKMERTLSDLAGDPYYCILEMHYAQGRNDAEIAEALGYDRSTITRNRRRLIELIAYRLYGSNGAYSIIG